MKKRKPQDEKVLEQLAKRLLSMPHKPREEMGGKRKPYKKPSTKTKKRA